MMTARQCDKQIFTVYIFLETLKSKAFPIIRAQRFYVTLKTIVALQLLQTQDFKGASVYAFKL